MPKAISKKLANSKTIMKNWFNCHSSNVGSSDEENPKILITGGLGQLGIKCAALLRSRYGKNNIILSDIRKPSKIARKSGPFVFLDVLNFKQLQKIVVNYKIDWIVHLSALLSAKGETNISLAIKVNIDGIHNVFNIANRYKLRIFVPSTIGAFGPESPKNPTPNITIQRPKTIYGVAKVHAELLGEYYHYRYGLDFRSLRFPGVISCDTPGGGTTDYGIAMFYNAVEGKHYECYLKPNTVLPMIYIDDCLRALTEFIALPNSALKRRVYNINAVNFSPEDLAAEIRNYYPDFQVMYKPDDLRQKIAESWPQVLDDSEARQDWSWKPNYNFHRLVETMVHKINVTNNFL